MKVRSPQALEFACHSSACRPPSSGGTGGSDDGGGTAPQVSKTSARAFGNALRKSGIDVASVSKATSRTWSVTLSDGSVHKLSSGADLSRLAGSKRPAAAPTPAPVKQPTKAGPIKDVGGKPMSTDAIADYISKNMKRDDFPGLVALTKLSGYDSRKPVKVSDAELAALNAKDPTNALARTAPKKANDGLVNGDSLDLREGASYHGEGLYFASGKSGSEHVAKHYGKKGYDTIQAHVDRHWERRARTCRTMSRPVRSPVGLAHARTLLAVGDLVGWSA